MLSDACHDFAHGDGDLKSLIDNLDYYENEYPAIYPKVLIDVLRKLADMAASDVDVRANLVRACLDVKNHYDYPLIEQSISAEDLAKQISIRYVKP